MSISPKYKWGKQAFKHSLLIWAQLGGVESLEVHQTRGLSDCVGVGSNCTEI